MIFRQNQGKGILSKLLEKGIKILLKKECNKIDSLKINIVVSSLQFIQGIIQEIYILAKGVDYKNLFFDEIELEANEVKNFFKLNNKELKLENNLILNFKISLSETSLKKIFLSKNWNWIGNTITREIFNQSELKDIKIENNQIIVKGTGNLNNGEKVEIQQVNGKLYLENKFYKKFYKFPIEDKVHIKYVNIENNLIIISANSPINF